MELSETKVWQWQVPVALADLWSVMADTARFNDANEQSHVFQVPHVLLIWSIIRQIINHCSHIGNHIRSTDSVVRHQTAIQIHEIAALRPQ